MMLEFGETLAQQHPIDVSWSHLSATRYCAMTSLIYVMVSGWKQTLASIASWYYDLELVLSSFSTRSNIVLIRTRPPIKFCMFHLFNSKSSLVEIYFSCSKYFSISCLTWCLRLASVSELIDGILWVLIMKSKLLYNHAYEAWMFMLYNQRSK